ncbi:hypothetical protein TCAL_04088 [Tigriopus californicus]|uniref:Uncharacterized protein n=1 Tax=Tigriopus californicus TaxID=6832 RepID=A0A553NVK9_TIGCA|nr:uncharacterized protein LOC131881182 isoform X2 [Tigriopus californicus]TRY69460.1 hypothetical protein TCAL_04088 [Tigriopus californicus]|eukprot:TCALIF_04088-PA protein Name:"Protein of unknown function" AED:0.00 eAED:0.00 QI:69/1/1/1/0/0.5/2/194/331
MANSFKTWSSISATKMMVLILLLNPMITMAMDVIEEEPNGAIDFTEGETQDDGSICVTKTKYVEKLEKQTVKECWHQNVTQCHETYVTEFRPNQEQVCEEHFWKACKITFKEKAYNYTLKSCMTPLVKKCEPPSRYSAEPPKTVCKTWFESQCNTTYKEVDGHQKPQTWCSKEPRQICAPDNCRMEPGDEVCHDKVIESTTQKPEEICDLQPSSHCRLVTNLVPHLESQQVCKDIPKEVCHLKLDNPKMVKKPVTLKWCRKPNEPEATPQYVASYDAPTPVSYQASQAQAPVVPQYAQPAAPQPASPSYGATASPVYYKPANQNLFQRARV